jgi:hypothetical protein
VLPTESHRDEAVGKTLQDFGMEPDVGSVDLEVTTPASRFSNCIKTEDYAPLDDVTEFKFYCPGVGLVREEPPRGRLDLVRYE